MRKIIDINCDMGESFGVYSIGNDEQVINYISSANIACGFHAGDPVIMSKTIAMAIKAGVSVGAHPGFYDLIGFGRCNIQVAPERIRQDIIYQLGALQGIARSQGTEVRHVKPHGSLYHIASNDGEIAQTIVEAVLAYDPELILMALAGSELERAARSSNLNLAREAFADRAYHASGDLVSRQKEGSVIEDIEAIGERVLRMVTEGRVKSVEGKDVEIDCDTICVHGDNKNALNITRHMTSILNENGIEVQPLPAVIKAR